MVEYPGRNENKKASYCDNIKKEKVVSFQTVKKKTPDTIPLDESKSFGEILSRFEGKKLKLRMIMDWPVNSKPYAIAAEDGKVRSNSKSLFRNYLQCLCQVKPSSDPSTAIQTSIVDAMRVARMISIKNANPPIFLSWAKNVFSYIHDLPGDNLHIVFDNYSHPEDPTKVLSKGRFGRGYKRKISSLNQALPKLDEWKDFLKNDRNKKQVCSLLADYFVSDEIVTWKTIYVTRGNLCLMKTLHNGQQMVSELCSNHREADHRYAQS